MSAPDQNTDFLPPGFLAVAIYNSHEDAVASIEVLQESGFNTLKLSIVDQITGRSCDRWGHQSAGIYSPGIPKISILRYETALKIDKSILIAQGTAQEVANSREMIIGTNPESVDEHQLEPADDELGLSE